jgi:predicted DNA-binding transcriptional regulator AlpA
MQGRSSASMRRTGFFIWARSARPRPEDDAMTKQPAAQIAASEKAAAIKAENKRPQPSWLQRPITALQSDAPPAPERLGIANQSQGPPRLLSKAEVLTITGVTFPTVWAWMRAGSFPRSRVVGGKSMWRSDEIAAWLDKLPQRKLKGDAA